MCWGSPSTVTIAKIFFTSPQQFQTCLMGQLCPKLLHVLQLSKLEGCIGTCQCFSAASFLCKLFVIPLVLIYGSFFFCVSLCVELFVAMEMNKAFVVSDGIEQLAIPMGVNKDLATMARKKMCVCFLW